MSSFDAGTRCVRLAAADELADPVPLRQDLRNEIVETLGPEFRVVEQSDNCAVEGRKRRREAKRFAFSGLTWVQHT